MNDEIAKKMAIKFCRQVIVFTNWFINRVERQNETDPEEIKSARSMIKELVDMVEHLEKR